MSKILNQQLYSNIVYGSESANGTLRLEATSSATKGAVQAVATSFELIVASAIARITHTNTATRIYTLPDCSGEILVSGRFLSTGDLFYGGTTAGTAQVLSGQPAGALTTNLAGVPQWSSGSNGQVLTVGSSGVPSFAALPDTGTIADSVANTIPYYASSGNDLVPLTTISNRLLGSPNGVPSWVLLTASFLRSFNGSQLGLGTAGYLLTATGDGGFQWAEPNKSEIIPGTQFAVPYYSLAVPGSTVAASQFLFVNETSRALELRNQGRFRMYESTSNGTNYIEFRAPGSIGPNVLWILPATDGVANSSLITDGFGNLSFADLGSVGYGAAAQLAYYAVDGNDVTNLATVADRALLSTPSSSFGWSLISTQYLSSGSGALTTGSSQQLLISNGTGGFVWEDAINVSGLVQSGQENYISFYPTTGRSVQATSFVKVNNAAKNLILDASSSLSFSGSGSNGFVSLKARGSLSSDGLVLDLPQADGLYGHGLVTDGSGGLSFIEVGRGNVLPTMSSKTLAYYTGTTLGGHGQLEALVGGPDKVMLSNSASEADWNLLDPKHLNTSPSIFQNDVLTIDSGAFSWKNPASLVGNVQEGQASFVAYYPSQGRELNDSNFLKVNELQKALELRSGGFGVKFYDSSDLESIALKAPTTLSASVSFTLPNADGTLNQALVTNGNGELFFTSLDYIGDAEDGSYTDGLFIDFESSTKIGTAVDRFNEVLKSLSPPPAPSFSQISFANNNGVEGKLSFGASNLISAYTNVDGGIGDWNELDINSMTTISSSAKGIFAPQAQTGLLASNVSAHSFSYPTNAFGDGEKGSLTINVNGLDVHSVNLGSFGSGSSLNANGSGFILSSATPVNFEQGSTLSVYRYRTGSWVVGVDDQRPGWNYLRVRHQFGATTRQSNYFEWVNDAETSDTVYLLQTLGSLDLSGSLFLSGVRYYRSGSATYQAVIENAYRNTYMTSSSSINHPITTNCSLADTIITNTSSHESQLTFSKSVTIEPEVNGRILGEDLIVSTQVLRTVQSSIEGDPIAGGWKILLDETTSSASELYEDFGSETFRRSSAVDTSLVTYTSNGVGGPGAWDSSLPLTDGLLVYNGCLCYPTMGFDGGDFRNITDGNLNGLTNPGGPLGNPNYSGMSGEKVYLRYFYIGEPKQNFVLSVNASDTSFVAASNKGSLTGNQVTLEILAPNTTKDISGTIAWKDATVPYTKDSAVGAYATTFGSSIPDSWGITLGTKSTVTSGLALLIRLTAPDTWEGKISALTLTPV